MSDKRSYCWGLNDNGQIGDGTSGSENNRFSPTESFILASSAELDIYIKNACAFKNVVVLSSYKSN